MCISFWYKVWPWLQAKKHKRGLFIGDGRECMWDNPRGQLGAIHTHICYRLHSCIRRLILATIMGYSTTWPIGYKETIEPNEAKKIPPYIIVTYMAKTADLLYLALFALYVLCKLE